VWDGVASAAGSDARKRDDGDAKASSRSDDAADGSAPPQPKGWTALRRRPPERDDEAIANDLKRVPVANCRTRRPHPFFSSLLRRRRSGDIHVSENGDPIETEIDTLIR